MTDVINRMKEQEAAVTSLLKAEKAYKNFSIFLFTIFVVISFFISLGSSKFDFNRILQAQFWIDFSITFGGGMILKGAFGKWGDYEGHKNTQVITAIDNVNKANQEIKEKNLVNKFLSWVGDVNRRRKIKAMKTKVFKKMHAWFTIRTKKHWRKMKDIVLTAELLESTKDDLKRTEYKKMLDEYGFDIDSYKIKYPVLRESALQSGFSSPSDSDAKLSYSEMYQLFGKNFLMTLFSFFLTVLLAITSVFLDDISLATVYIFGSRVLSFAMNAYTGFSVGKSGVEKIKLSILQTIHRLLSSFLEVAQETK